MVRFFGNNSRSQCCHLGPMKTVCFCLCWHAELVSGGHNSHTHSHTCTFSLLSVQACLHAGRGRLPCKIAMFLYSGAPMSNLFGLSLEYVGR